MRWLILASLLAAGPVLADAPPPDPAEAFPGGAASAPVSDPSAAFAKPAGTLPDALKARFLAGADLFYTRWTPGPAPPPALIGLGPLYNALSCEQCHRNDGRGRPPGVAPEEKAREITGAVARFADPTSPYGAQLQDRAVSGAAPEGRFLKLGAGWIAERPDGQLIPEPVSVVVAPAVTGVGLLEAIPEAVLDAGADPEDLDGDGVSGRRGPGRFGWRAQAVDLWDQTTRALHLDMGLSTATAGRTAPWGDCTDAQTACLRAARATGAEVPETVVADLVLYLQGLGPPERSEAAVMETASGRAIFRDIGCTACHTPRYDTAQVTGKPWLSGHVIWPYTDLLLHDMGEGLADAGGSEWRTPPLWGLGRHGAVNGNAYFLHDGRADSIDAAIGWHGGEAEAARERYVALPTEDRAALLAFLKSL